MLTNPRRKTHSATDRRAVLVTVRVLCLLTMGAQVQAEEALPMTRHELPDGRLYFAIHTAERPAVPEPGRITVIGPSDAGSDNQPIAGKSAGNCTNACEYWDQHANSGQGACFPLPAGTAIEGQPCKMCDDSGGITNRPAGTAVPDKPCQVCDGMGSVTNRPDGVQVTNQTPLGAYYRCCGGEPIDPNWYACCGGKPQSYATQQCCCAKYVYDPNNKGCCVTEFNQRCMLTDNPEKGVNPCEALPPQSNALAHVLCYNGKPIPCVYPAKFPPEWPAAIAETCAKAHEQAHVDDGRRTRCYLCEPYHAGYPITASAAGECEAYRAELKCIDENKQDSEAWRRLRADVVRTGQPFCKEAGLPPIQ